MKKKILIVDDEILLLKMLEKHFQLQGFSQIYTVTNGVDALKLSIENKPDVILLDNQLPDINGVELINLIRKKSPESSIIIMTGQIEKKTATKSLERGALDFIAKPIDFDYLNSIFLSKNIIPDKK